MSNTLFQNKIQFNPGDYTNVPDCLVTEIRAENVEGNDFKPFSFEKRVIPFDAELIGYNKSVWDLVGIAKEDATFIALQIYNPDPTQATLNDVRLSLTIDSTLSIQVAQLSFLNATSGLPEIFINDVNVPLERKALLVISAG